MLVAVLLAVQPTGLLAQTDESIPATFAVVGVAAATLRAEPDGLSMALAIVPAGSVVVSAGADAEAAGVVWRRVRTSEGSVGYLPAGFLALVSGGTVTGDPLTRERMTRPSAAPAQSVGAAPEPTTTAASTAPATTVPTTSAVQASAGSGGSASPTTAQQPTPVPSPATGGTAKESRAGQAVTGTRIVEQPAPNGRKMGAGRIVVGFKPGASQQGRSAAHQAAGTLSTSSAGRPDVLVAQVDPGSIQRALTAYRSRADVAWAEPDYIVRATLVPNDPIFSSQWGPTKIGAPIAWDVTTGDASTLIAILDTGIHSEHPDLLGKVHLERNLVNPGASAGDVYGHGTLMAGIAAASTNNAQGMAGVGFNVRLLNGKVLDDAGNGLDSTVAAGITWATDNGAKVISMSLGGDGACSQTLQDAVDYAWNSNVVVVASSGNGGPDGIGDPAPESPGSCTHAIAVGAIDQDDARPSFSNFGTSVQLTAPGVFIASTTRFGTYDLVSGTSPATPHVAATAALLVSTLDDTSNQSIVTRLLSTADPIVGTGSIWGNGRVNAAAAVGPASCAPRPRVVVSSTPTGSALNVAVSTTGVGNAVRFVRTGAAAGTTLNALVSFPTPSSETAGATLYVPRTVGTTATFQVQRSVAGSPTTLPFIVTDGCGDWKSFVGGGTGAGF